MTNTNAILQYLNNAEVAPTDVLGKTFALSFNKVFEILQERVVGPENEAGPTFSGGGNQQECKKNEEEEEEDAIILSDNEEEDKEKTPPINENMQTPSPIRIQRETAAGGGGIGDPPPTPPGSPPNDPPPPKSPPSSHKTPGSSSIAGDKGKGIS